jgi:hypothetical protein
MQCLTTISGLLRLCKNKNRQLILYVEYMLVSYVGSLCYVASRYGTIRVHIWKQLIPFMERADSAFGIYKIPIAFTHVLTVGHEVPSD